MKIKKIKFGKLLLVIFLTLLIWIWADLKLEDSLTTDAVIKIGKTIESNTWISFSNKPSVHIEELRLVGPASKIDKVNRDLDAGTFDFEFFYRPGSDEAVSPGYTMDVLNFLRNERQFEKLGISVESCNPRTVSVQVVVLGEKSLEVVCLSAKNGDKVETTVIEPAKINMDVPPDWEGEKLKAYVMLTELEINHAISTPITKRPYIDLVSGERREAKTEVNITTTPEKSRLKPDTVTKVTLGFVFGVLTKGKYDVEVKNLEQVIGQINIKTTPEAKREYESMRYQVLLEIEDDDVGKGEQSRELIYNFPRGKTDQIELNQPPASAVFKLIPVNPLP